MIDGEVDVSKSWFPEAMLSWNENPLFKITYELNNLYALFIFFSFASMDSISNTVTLPSLCDRFFDPILRNEKFGIKSDEERRKLFSSCNVFEPIRYKAGQGWARDGHVFGTDASISNTLPRNAIPEVQNPLNKTNKSSFLGAPSRLGASIPDPTTAIPDPL